MILRLLLTIGLLYLPIPTLAEDLVPDQVTTVKAQLKKRSLVVAIHTRTTRTTELLGKRLAAAWALGETALVIQELAISVGAASIFVPRSSYADLLDVRDAEIRPKGNSAVVVIRGGDAANSFEAHIEIDGTRVRMRKIVAPALPGGPTEETTYHHRVMEDVP